MAEGLGRRTGRGGRDAALTWDVPPVMEGDGSSAAAARPAFAAVAAKHQEGLVRQLLEAEGLEAEAVDAWAPLVCQLAQQAAAALSPTAAVAHGKLDPRHYVKVKRVVSPGAAPAESSVVLGVACRKSLAHKRMRSSISQPRIMLLAGGLEPALAAPPGLGRASASSGLGSLGNAFSSSVGGSGGGGGGHAKQSSLSSFDAMLDQERHSLAAAVDRIASFSPDVLLVERSVARYAQELLLQKDVSLVLNVKLELLERLARCMGSQVAPSLEQLTSHCVGFCKEFEVEALPTATSTAAAGGTAAGGGTAPGSVDASPRLPSDAAPDGQHLVGDPAALRRAATLGSATAAAAAVAGGGGSGGPRALMRFRGCPRPLGATILLRGSDAGELRRVKRVASFAIYAAYWGLLESALLADQLAAAAAAVLPCSGGGGAEAVAGLADAVASTSYLATAEARGRQAILSASPHVSVVLEQSAPAEELELPPEAAEGQQEQQEHDGSSSCGGSGGSRGVEEGWEVEAPDSPASSDSTNLWVLPAEAGAATFTVAGSQIQTEADEAAAAGAQQQGGSDMRLSNGSAAGDLADDVAEVPESPQDPLHLAAKELALQQLQLTGSGPPSPLAVGLAVDPSEPQPPPAAARGSEGASAAQLSPQSSASALAQQLAAAQRAAGLPAEASWASAGGGSGRALPPGLRAYTSQRLWLAISCKNPARGILCEPSHAHCMEFYADTDLPLAAFLSAAAPPNRKCPHPQCGEGAPLHLRSFMHGNGLVTLSSVRLPAGKELPDGRVWLWLRPTGGRGGDSARRVPLSPEAACLSFAHLLSLLFDARQLALGGLSLQRDFVRYLGVGSTLLCLHFSPAPAFAVRMPPRQVELLAEQEQEWLQEEIKGLTEEADEAFGAIEYALEQQLAALEGPGGALEAPDPEFRAMWLGTLIDTRAGFLELVQDTITLLDSALPPGGADSDQQQQQAEQPQTAVREARVVWELNRLRSILAALVLQWATALHEGAAGSHAAPPSGAGMLNTVLATRRQAAHHSRHSSLGEVQPAAAVPAEDLALSAFVQEAEQQQQQQRQLEPGPSLQQPQPEEQPPTQQPPAAHQPQLQPTQPEPPPQVALQTNYSLARSTSGISLGRQFLEAGGPGGGVAAAAPSELDFGAPSLVAGDDGGVGGSSSLATSPQGSIVLPSNIPTGLVARYIAMFDQRGPEASGTSGSPGTSPGTSPGGGPAASRSQRTLTWVQTSSPTAAELAEAREAAAAAAGSMAPGLGSPNDAQQQQQQEQQQEQERGSGGSEQPPPLQPLVKQRSSMFRLDLTNPDPDLLAHALTPTRRRSTEEQELPPTGVLGDLLQQISARLSHMSLSQSFTERRRSTTLGHAPSADQRSLWPAVADAQRLQAAAAQLEGAEEAALQGKQQQQQEKQQQAERSVVGTVGGPSSGGSAAAQTAAEEDIAAGLAAAAPTAAPAPAPAPVEPAAAAAVDEGHLAAPSAQDSVSHFDEWNALLNNAAAPAEAAAAAAASAAVADAGAAVEAADAAGSEVTSTVGSLSLPSSLKMLKSASSGKLDAITKLQEAPMPPALALPAGTAEVASSSAASSAAMADVAAAAALPALRVGLLPTATSRSLGATPLAGWGAAPAPPSPPTQPPPVEKAPSKLRQLLGRLRAEVPPGQLPLTAGRVELSGRALLPGGADGMRVAVFDDEPTSIVAYFLATREYQQYLHDAVATILFGEAPAGQGGSGGDGTASAGADSETGAAAVPGSWRSLPPISPHGGGGANNANAQRRSSLVPGLQAQAQAQQQQGAATMGGDEASGQAEAAAATEGASGGVAGGTATAPLSSRTVTQEDLAAEQSGDWQVLFHEQQLDCQLTMEDPSPGMPWGRAKFQVTAYYAPQFAELRRRCVAGGEGAYLASISRCRKWASRGGKSAAYFARTSDKRYIIKQLSRSERQSFLEFAPDYFRYVATMLHRGQDTCLAKILGVYQVSVQYTGGRGAPGAPPFGGKEGVMDLLVTENVFYGRDSQVSRIYDLKGSQRDRYAADDPAAAGTVLLDENLKEMNLAAPTLVGPRAYARLQRALWSDTSFLAGLGVMDYSLLVGVDKERQELVVGVIDYIRQYTWDKQVETWVKKSGILGGAGKDPTVISPKQYSRRFRIAMSSYLTVVPSWEPPEPPLDPDAV